MTSVLAAGREGFRARGYTRRLFMHYTRRYIRNTEYRIHLDNAKAKDKSANKIINDKGLDIDFRAITFTSYGGFGTDVMRPSRNG